MGLTRRDVVALLLTFSVAIAGAARLPKLQPRHRVLLQEESAGEQPQVQAGGLYLPSGPNGTRYVTVTYEIKDPAAPAFEGAACEAFVAALLDGLLTSEELGLGSDAVVATLACHAKPNQAHLMAVLPLSPQGLASLTAKASTPAVGDVVVAAAFSARELPCGAVLRLAAVGDVISNGPTDAVYNTEAQYDYGCRLAAPSQCQAPGSPVAVNSTLACSCYKAPASLPIQEGLIFSFLSDASVEPTPFTEADCKVFSAALQGGFSMAGLPLSSPPSCVTEVNEGTPSVRALLPLPPTDVAQLLSQYNATLGGLAVAAAHATGRTLTCNTGVLLEVVQAVLSYETGAFEGQHLMFHCSGALKGVTLPGVTLVPVDSCTCQPVPLVTPTPTPVAAPSTPSPILEGGDLSTTPEASPSSADPSEGSASEDSAGALPPLAFKPDTFNVPMKVQLAGADKAFAGDYELQYELGRAMTPVMRGALRSLWEVEYGPTIQGDGSAGALFFELTDVYPVDLLTLWKQGAVYGPNLVRTINTVFQRMTGSPFSCSTVITIQLSQITTYKGAVFSNTVLACPDKFPAGLAARDVKVPLQDMCTRCPKPAPVPMNVTVEFNFGQPPEDVEAVGAAFADDVPLLLTTGLWAQVPALSTLAAPEAVVETRGPNVFTATFTVLNTQASALLQAVVAKDGRTRRAFSDALFSAMHWGEDGDSEQPLQGWAVGCGSSVTLSFPGLKVRDVVFACDPDAVEGATAFGPTAGALPFSCAFCSF